MLPTVVIIVFLNQSNCLKLVVLGVIVKKYRIFQRGGKLGRYNELRRKNSI